MAYYFPGQTRQKASIRYNSLPESESSSCTISDILFIDFKVAKKDLLQDRSDRKPCVSHFYPAVFLACMRLLWLSKGLPPIPKTSASSTVYFYMFYILYK